MKKTNEHERSRRLPIRDQAKENSVSRVMKQVAHDLRRFDGATTAIERELYFDAYQLDHIR